MICALTPLSEFSENPRLWTNSRNLSGDVAPFFFQEHTDLSPFLLFGLSQYHSEEVPVINSTVG